MTGLEHVRFADEELIKTQVLKGEAAQTIIRGENCSVYKMENETGEGVITRYPVFPGIELLYDDMVMQDVNHQLFTEDVLDELLLSMDGEDEKTDTARAKEILNSLDLLDKVKLHPMSLSGGEKQRVAIGSAIASDKKILIFDEPTSGLDYRHMLEVSDNLNRLKEMGKSLLLITHDPELIYKCCTYLLFIQGSKVLWHRPMDGDAVRLLRAFFSHEQGAGVCNAS